MGNLGKLQAKKTGDEANLAAGGEAARQWGGEIPDARVLRVKL
jgi:hypothetical protein